MAIMVAMLRVGLTGGIASGKTAVSDLLSDHGADVIDADVLAREVVEPGTPALAAIIERFGPRLLADDGTLNRQALGKIIFSDPQARHDLEQIIHPAVRARAAELEQAAAVEAIVVHVIPLLVETGQSDRFDLLVVVDLAPETQLARLMARGSLTEADATARIAAQATREERLAVADLVIENDGTPAELAENVDRLWASLCQRRDERNGNL